MKQLGAEAKERKELQRWMASAFEAYATRFAGAAISCQRNETPQHHQARIQSYGQAFSDVIGDRAIQMGDIAKLLDDLTRLRQSNCPVLDLVELMLLCTEDFTMRTADLLLRVGVKKKDLVTLQCTLNQTAHAIEVLSQPTLPTLDHIEEKFPSKHEQQRIRSLFKTVPDELRSLSLFLDNYPAKPDPITAANQDHFCLGWFYLLVARWGLGSPTLSRLLKAMRCARESISPPKKRHRSFGEKAIERRLSRYWEKIGSDSKFEMEFQVFMYMELPIYKRLRRRGETLLSLLPQLELDYEANAPGFFAWMKAQTDES